MKIKVAQFGVGPIGLEVIKLAATQASMQVVGAVDIDPEKAGQDLGELSRQPTLTGRRVHASLEQLLAHGSPDLIFHTSVSDIEMAMAQITAIAKRGISVVSSCERLIFPRLAAPGMAAKLDSLCRRSGARVVGTGVNPGFVMDYLPICLSGVCREIREIHVQRVVNASTRRYPLQKKIGSGMPPRTFQRLLDAGHAGHAGLKESLALIAHALGWELNSITERGKAVVAEKEIQTAYLKVPAGRTCGIHQRAEGRIGKQIRLSLDLKMFLDAPEPMDAVQVIGEPPINVVIPGGVAGDQATVAMMVNTAPRLLKATPGLKLVTDLPLAV
jgi:4-hydroxy-tetrahydrodipicolinate reductase